MQDPRRIMIVGLIAVLIVTVIVTPLLGHSAARERRPHPALKKQTPHLRQQQLWSLPTHLFPSRLAGPTTIVRTFRPTTRGFEEPPTTTTGLPFPLAEDGGAYWFEDRDELRPYLDQYLQDRFQQSIAPAVPTMSDSWPRIGAWCVSKISFFRACSPCSAKESRYEMFHAFDEPLNDWNVSNATSMRQMLYAALIKT